MYKKRRKRPIKKSLNKTCGWPLDDGVPAVVRSCLSHNRAAREQGRETIKNGDKCTIEKLC